MPDADHDDGVVGHLGPGDDVNVPGAYTHELILTRNEGELARQAAYTPLSRAHCVRALHAGDASYERTQCKPSLGSEQQLNPEVHDTQKQLSSHNLTLSHKKESTQLSKAEACWHKHRYTKPAVNLDKLHHHVGGPHKCCSLFHPRPHNMCDRLLWLDDIRSLEAAAAGTANTAASPDDWQLPGKFLTLYANFCFIMLMHIGDTSLGKAASIVVISADTTEFWIPHSHNGPGAWTGNYCFCCFALLCICPRCRQRSAGLQWD